VVAGQTRQPGRSPADPHQDILTELAERLDYAEAHGLADEAAEVEEEAKAVAAMDEDGVPVPPDICQFLDILRQFGWTGPQLDPIILKNLAPSTHIWADRLRASRRRPLTKP
jgi:hypothetical protein